MRLTERQKEITDIVRENGPITGEQIAERLHVTRSALRGDLAVLLSGEIIAARRRLGYYYLGGGEDPAAMEIRKCTAAECMSKPALVPVTASAYDAAVLLFTRDIGTVFIGTQDDVQGVVSRKDLLKAAMGRENLQSMPISMVMTSKSKMIFATPEESMVDVAKKLIDFEIDCLPVITIEEDNGVKKYALCGRLSKTNITRLFLKLGKGKGR
ncbi:helix-turn-helix transcriptional regulator [Allisonella histaminiformans]|uniref:helix-turn-helix transcriptional regulator n=1 Tax=Allisonella histaminiformans TaxID=209880 RepID=UPI002409C19B|nr:helix-turn-helix transcriptional regulator [Allisonella histaminiformans]MDD6870225.1 helix-turn-helix transcriptional regulator [Allisonella histaminiformans]